MNYRTSFQKVNWCHIVLFLSTGNLMTSVLQFLLERRALKLLSKFNFFIQTWHYCKLQNSGFYVAWELDSPFASTLEQLSSFLSILFSFFFFKPFCFLNWNHKRVVHVLFVVFCCSFFFLLSYNSKQKLFLGTQIFNAQIPCGIFGWS